jgi:hypothetical protein
VDTLYNSRKNNSEKVDTSCRPFSFYVSFTIRKTANGLAIFLKYNVELLCPRALHPIQVRLVCEENHHARKTYIASHLPYLYAIALSTLCTGLIVSHSVDIWWISACISRCTSMYTSLCKTTMRRAFPHHTPQMPPNFPRAPLQ